MDDVLGALEAQLLELQKYKARFGELEPETSSNTLANRKKSTRQSNRQSKPLKVDTQQITS
jgi:adenylate cyclase